MKGKYEFHIRNARVRYELTLDHKITMIVGKSGSGKTSLCRLCEEAMDETNDTVHSNFRDRIMVLTAAQSKVLRATLSGLKDMFIFVDESFPGLHSYNFADAIKHSDNYFVICSRAPLNTLSYSLDSVYSLKTSKSNRGTPYLTKLLPEYKVYSNPRIPDLIITEDSKSGYEMMKFMNICDVISAGGNAGLYKTALDNIGTHNNVLILADKAGLGSQARRMVELDKEYGSRLSLAVPESFEWLILTESKMRQGIEDKLNHTYNYCDAGTYDSWEEFYTALLEERFPLVERCDYVKSPLPNALKCEKYAKHISKMLPDLIVPEGTFTDLTD